MTTIPQSGEADETASQAHGALFQRICGGCGEQFTPTRTDQRHCRASCRARASRVRRERPQPELFHGTGGYQPE